MTWPEACPLCGAQLHVWDAENARCSGCGQQPRQLEDVPTATADAATVLAAARRIGAEIWWAQQVEAQRQMVFGQMVVDAIGGEAKADRP